MIKLLSHFVVNIARIIKHQFWFEIMIICSPNMLMFLIFEKNFFTFGIFFLYAWLTIMLIRFFDDSHFDLKIKTKMTFIIKTNRILIFFDWIWLQHYFNKIYLFFLKIWLHHFFFANYTFMIIHNVHNFFYCFIAFFYFNFVCNLFSNENAFFKIIVFKKLLCVMNMFDNHFEQTVSFFFMIRSMIAKRRRRILTYFTNSFFGDTCCCMNVFISGWSVKT